MDQPTSSTDSAAKAPTPEPLPDLAGALWQLRAVVCGLGAAVLVFSVTFNVFVWKQNRNITAQTNVRTTQLARLQAVLERLRPAVNDIARYSAGKPELIAVFSRFGLEIPAAGTSAAPTATSSPLPP